MNAEQLIARALEQRDTWVDLGGGQRVRVRRPPAAEMFAFGRASKADLFLRCVVGWEGFTEASVLGAAVGASDPIPFDVELWLVLALDRMEWIGAVSQTVVDAITGHLKQQEADRKN